MSQTKKAAMAAAAAAQQVEQHVPEEVELQRHIACAQQLSSLLDDDTSEASQSVAYSELLDELLLDVAQEAHREAKTGTGLDCVALAAVMQPPGLRPQPLPPKPGTRGPVDVFGQNHPPKATEIVTCRNCGRQVQAGSFAPHLEKCMGKGRAAARAASRRLAGLS